METAAPLTAVVKPKRSSDHTGQHFPAALLLPVIIVACLGRLAFKTNLKASEFIIIIIIMQWILASHKIKMNVVFSTKETFFAQLISNNIAYMTKEQISITNNLSS